MPLSNVSFNDAGSVSRSVLRHRFFLIFALVLASSILSLLKATDATAQVVGDQTLSGSENTHAVLSDGTYEITNGSIRGASSELLFHSFDSFSIEAGQTAEFVIDKNISTIFSRITGGSLSQIDGTISADVANLFFINPAGVVFGPEASVEVGGSVMISTAEAITFGKDSEFSAAHPQPVPLLRVSQPIGLSLGETSRDISIDGAFLEVDLSETVLFVGNGITFTDGGIIAPSGQVELISLAPGSRLNVLPANDTLISRLDTVEAIDTEEERLRATNLREEFRDIQLLAGGFVDTSGEDDSASGRILLRGRQIDLQGGEVVSFNFSDLQGGDLSIFASAGLSVDDDSLISTEILGSGDGGDILIEVRGAFDLLGRSRLRSQVRQEATGAAGSMTIRAGQLSIRDGSEASTSALGEGLGGTLTIEVPNGTVEVSGVSPIRSSRLISRTVGSQPAGAIEIVAKNLLVRSGGQIDAGTSGSGNSPGIVIRVAESVLVGEELDGIASAITSSNTRGSTGDVGTIDLSARHLQIANGGRIFTSTNGSGQGGDLIVDAEEVVLSGSGNALNGLFGLFARTEGSGDSGRLDLTTGSLTVRDGARLTVSTDDDAPIENLGTVRDAVITANTVVLDGGSITAESRSRNGGNLIFNVRDFLLLRNGGLISATAGTAAAGGDGGNVSITSPTGFILAIPDEDSDILANAFSGTGGNISINTQSIIGLEARRAIADNGTNDIDASSEFGIDGTIILNNLELDPTEGIIELPVEAVSPGQIAERCLADSTGQNAFVVTGQGGVTPGPGDIVRNEALTVDVATTVTTDMAVVEADGDRFRDVSVDTSSVDTSSVDTSPRATIVEANGWRRDQEGTVVFVASDRLAATTDSAHYHSCLNQTLVQRE
ncbi:MAG: filamentous hemagglutinin N-terminal domain-containing protein [Phormidesmis sp.]